MQWYSESSSVHNTTVSSWFHIGSVFIDLYFSLLRLFCSCFLCMSVFSSSMLFYYFLVVLCLASYISLKIMRKHMVRQFYEPIHDGYLNRKFWVSSKLLAVFYYELNKVRYISKVDGNIIPLGSAQLTVVWRHVNKLYVLNWKQYCQGRPAFRTWASISILYLHPLEPLIKLSVSDGPTSLDSCPLVVHSYEIMLKYRWCWLQRRNRV